MGKSKCTCIRAGYLPPFVAVGHIEFKFYIPPLGRNGGEEIEVSGTLLGVWNVAAETLSKIVISPKQRGFCGGWQGRASGTRPNAPTKKLSNP